MGPVAVFVVVVTRLAIRFNDVVTAGLLSSASMRFNPTDTPMAILPLDTPNFISLTEMGKLEEERFTFALKLPLRIYGLSVDSCRLVNCRPVLSLLCNSGWLKNIPPDSVARPDNLLSFFVKLRELPLFSLSVPPKGMEYTFVSSMLTKKLRSSTPLFSATVARYPSVSLLTKGSPITPLNAPPVR